MVNIPVMDVEKIMAALTNQREALTSHAQLLQQYGQSIQQLVTQTSRAPVLDPDPQPASDATPPTPGPEPRLPTPQRYDGKPGECRGFLTQCQLTFELQPSPFRTQRARIAYVITLLTDKARAWATAVWQGQGPEYSDFNTFSEDMLRVFDQSFSSDESTKKLMSIHQGKGIVADYAIAFRTLAAVSEWNESAFVVVFHHGLSDSQGWIGCCRLPQWS